MISEYHSRHKRISHNNCDDCRADCERQYLRSRWPGYEHVTEYLNIVKPRLAAIRNGENSVNAQIWKREFIRALHRRISLRVSAETGRKRCPGYRDRLRQFRNPDGSFMPGVDSFYLRRFAQRGASTLH